jgi:acetyltransferase-like isoleucine patch superfamily enzyme
MAGFKDIQIPDEEFALLTRYSSGTYDYEECRRRAVVIGFDKPGTNIAHGAVIRIHSRDAIGSGVTIAMNCYLNGNVTVEDNVLIGPGCALTAGHHKFDAATGWFSARTEKDGDDSIVIGFGSWLCAHVTVTAGVKIGRANMICAGAVVTRSTPDYAIIGGIPARQIGRIDPVSGEYIWYRS